MSDKNDSNTQIFDNWSDVTRVDCNKCVSYWDSSCDGVIQGSERRCKAFKAIRSTDIPLRLETLEKRFKDVLISCALIGCVLLIHILSELL